MPARSSPYIRSYFMQMNPDRIHIQRLQALDFWRAPIALEPLPGGITNLNYRVRMGAETYVARLSVELALLGIDRRNEVVCQRAAHSLGVAPAVIHHETGVLISEYIPGRTLSPPDVRDLAFVPRIAHVLRTLHDGWDTLNGEFLYFSAFQTVRTYARTAAELKAKLPVDIDALLEDARRLSGRIAPFVPVLCHNDLLPANILDDGHSVLLVDWEYAGIGHPLFDLAGVSANSGFDDSLDALFLAFYRSTTDVCPRDLAELRILKTMSLLREALWSAIQSVASNIPFDYTQYAATNFLAYREARAKFIDS